jgi:autophagy-related protein 9
LHWLLFTGPYSPWRDYYTLKDEYKHAENLPRLSEQMNTCILYLAIANLLLAPLIFLWQILYSFFNYAQVLKRQPTAVGMRWWSNYAR